MYTVDDLIDAIVEQLAPLYAKPASGMGGAPASKSAVSGKFPPDSASQTAAKRRIFLSELDVKKALTPGQNVLTIGPNVIVSPLALDWLALKGIRIVRS